MPATPFPPARFETARPSDLALIRALYGLTEGFFGRGYRFAMRRVASRLAGKTATMVFEDGSRFAFPLDDAYWNRLAAAAFAYEPEIAWVLRKCAALDYTFIDAGANFGFWSVIASSRAFGSKRVLAIEASAETFAVLQRNCAANGGRFETFKNAIFDKDDVDLSFSTGHHTARQLNGGTAGETVRTITLDTLASRAGVDLGKPVIVKLDVEGADAAALAGATAILAHDALVIYEEHGMDATHAMTRLMLGKLGLNAVYLDESGHLHAISDVEQMGAHKRNPQKGYNLFAFRAGSVFEPGLKV